MKKAIILLLMQSGAFVLHAQSQADSASLIVLNQQIDDYVVQQQVGALDKLYATDFVFSHGTGKVEGKEGWLQTVSRAKYLLRRHDSVKVELHPGLAILRGHLYVHRVDKDKTARYHLQYIRVYAMREKQWQMISHITTKEEHE